MKEPGSPYPIRSVFWKSLNKRPPELDVGSVRNQRFDFFAFFFFATFFVVFFVPTAFRPADDFDFFADLVDDFLAAFLTAFFGVFAALATFFAAAFLTDVGMRLATAFFACFATVFTALSAKAPAA